MIHIFTQDENLNWSVWIDPDESGIGVGRCIGLGVTKKIALQDAKASLEEDLRYVNEQLKKEN